MNLIEKRLVHQHKLTLSRARNFSIILTEESTLFGFAQFKLPTKTFGIF